LKVEKGAVNGNTHNAIRLAAKNFATKVRGSACSEKSGLIVLTPSRIKIGAKGRDHPIARFGRKLRQRTTTARFDAAPFCAINVASLRCSDNFVQSASGGRSASWFDAAKIYSFVCHMAGAYINVSHPPPGS
jgi:hypothetical protein